MREKIPGCGDREGNYSEFRGAEGGKRLGAVRDPAIHQGEEEISPALGCENRMQ